MPTHSAEYLPVAINGTSYAIDPSGYRRTTVPILREQFDQSPEASEARLNTQYWVRSQTDWSFGAGQQYLDNFDSDRRRYWTSSGIDPWTKGIAKLLPLCETKNNANAWTDVLARMFSDGTTDYCYVATGNDLYYSTNFDLADGSVTWTQVTDHASNPTITDIASDGTTVFVAYGASNALASTGIGTTTAPTNLGSLTPDWVKVVGGRLIVGDANVLNELDVAGAAQGLTSTLTHPGATWVTAAAGPVGIYAAANGNGTGSIHYVPVDALNGLLGFARQVAELPRGETINDMIAYGGLLALATSKGFRVVAVDNQNGGVSYGPVIDDGGEAFSLAADDRFVWWGAGSGKLYRADLSVFTDSLVPAWAPDLVSVGDGNALGNVTYLMRAGGETVFIDAGNGVQSHESTGDLVASGTLEVGDVRWNTQFDKILRTVEVRSSPSEVAGGNVTYNDSGETYDDSDMFYDGEKITASGTVQVQFTTDTGITTNLQTLTDKTETVVTPETPKSDSFAVVFTLNRDATTLTAGPELESWLIQAFVAPTRIDEIIVPIILRRRVATSRGMGAAVTIDPQAEYDALRTLMKNKSVVTYEEGERSQSVVIDQMSMTASKLSDDADWWEGELTLRLLTVPPST